MKYGKEVVQRYEFLQEQAKLIERELAEIKKQFIASNGGETEDHVITLKDNFRETVASKADFEAKLGASFLKDNGLLKLTAYNTVVISLKNRKAAA
jgi:hypothetical protein